MAQRMQRIVIGPVVGMIFGCVGLSWQATLSLPGGCSLRCRCFLAGHRALGLLCVSTAFSCLLRFLYVTRPSELH